MSSAAKPEQVLKELTEQWDKLGAESDRGVLRACSMTLVVVAEDANDAAAARRTVGCLMHDHPSRALVLYHVPNVPLNARVFSECWMPFNQTKQICSEGIEIASDLSDVSDLAKFLLPLQVPDLPTVLWCRGSRSIGSKWLQPLYPLTDKIIFDTMAVSRTSAALSFLRRVKSEGRRVADLHWTRLTGWREILAHLFDDEAMRPSDVASATVVHGGEPPSTCAIYFAAWIRTALPQVRLSMQSAGGSPGLRSVTLFSVSGDLTLTREDNVVHVVGRGRDYHSALPPADEESLMQEELKILSDDPIYDRVLA